MARRISGLTVSSRGTAQVYRRLNAAKPSEAHAIIAAAMYAHAMDVIAQSVAHYVPIMDSELKNSNYVSLPETDASGAPIVKMGFRAKHAVVTHENPRAGKTGGVSPSGRRYKKWAKVGGWKYLTLPLNASRGDFNRAIAAAVARAQAVAGSA